MALTTNQGLILPDGTDNANVPLTFTDFVTTAGSGMENRLVQRYLSTADRTARNPAPNEGELSWLSDLNVYQYFDGANWLNLVKGFVAESIRTTSVTPITTTEIITDQLQFTAVAGVRYKLTFNSSSQSTVANDVSAYRFRWQAGGVLTSAGTQFDVDAMVYPFTSKMLICRAATVTGIPAGTTSIGIGMIRTGGAGNVSSLASVNQTSTLILEIV